MTGAETVIILICLVGLLGFALIATWIWALFIWWKLPHLQAEQELTCEKNRHLIVSQHEEKRGE